MGKVYKPIGELGKIVTGKTPKTDIALNWGGSIPFITPSDILGYNSYYQGNTERYVSDDGVEKQKATLLPPNSVCFTCIASIGKSCLTRVSSITNQQINSIIPNKHIDYRYLLYMLRYNLPYIQMVGGGSGSGTPIISKNKFAKFKFLVEESLPIQHRIASILSTYDTLIENNTKRICLLEKMAENLYKEWFSYNRIKNDAKVVRLTDIITITRGLSYSSEEIECNEGVDLINLKNIQSYGGFRYDGTKKFGGKYKDEQIVCNGDLVMGVTDMTQDRRTVGSVALIPDTGKLSVISADLIKITSEISSVFLFGMFKYGSVSKYVAQFANGANVLHLRPKVLHNVKVLLPSLELVKEYVEKVSPIISEQNKLYVLSTQLARQRDLLLPRLMSGKLEVKVKA